MRKKKWLLITIFILIFINLVLLILPRLINFNRIATRKLTATVKKNYNADISFGNINATTKFLQLSDVNVIERGGGYSFSAKQLYFGFNFWKFIYKGFRFERAIKNISCFSPNLKINYAKSKTETTLPDWEKVRNQIRKFPDCSIINGKIGLKSAMKNSEFHEILSEINFSLSKTKDISKLEFSARNFQDSGKLTASGSIRDDDIDIVCKINDYSCSPLKMGNLFFKHLKFSLELPIKGNAPPNVASLSIEKIMAEWSNKTIFSHNISLGLKLHDLVFTKICSVSVDDIPIQLRGKIKNVFDKNRSVEVDFFAEDLPVERFHEKINGTISFSGSIKKQLSNPTIFHTIQSQKLGFGSTQIRNFKYSGIYQNNKIDSICGDFKLLKRKINFTGNINLDREDINQSKINLQVKASEFQTKWAGEIVGGDFIANISSTIKKPIVHAEVTNLHYASDILSFNKLNGDVNFRDNDLTFSFSDKNGSLKMQGKYKSIFQSPSLDLKLLTKNFSIKKLFKDSHPLISRYHPIISGGFRVTGEKHNFNFSGDIEFPANINRAFEGKITAKGNYSSDPLDRFSKLMVRSDSLIVNGEEFKLFLDSEEQNGLVNIKKLAINDQIDAKFSLFFKNRQIDLRNSLGSLQFSQINFNQLKTLGLISPQFPLQGLAKGIIETDSINNCINGKINIDSLKFGEQFEKMSSELSFCLNDTLLQILNLNARNKNKDIFCGKGTVSLRKPLRLNLQGNCKNLESSDIFKSDVFNFRGNYGVLLTGKLTAPKLLFRAKITNGKIFNTHFDYANIQFFQDSEILYLKKMNISKADIFNLAAQGKYSFNIFSQKPFNHSDGIDLNFEGDALDIISNYTDNISNCKSQTDFKAVVSSGENGLQIDTGELSIEHGEMDVKGQPETVRDLSLHCIFEDNFANDLKASFKMRNGEMFIRNKINENSSDIRLGNINFGSILLNTSPKGVGLHLPIYTPEKSITEVQLRGFRDKYFRIYKEKGNLKFLGEMVFSNGTAINKRPKKKKSSPIKRSIFSVCAFDMNFIFKKNVWYIEPPLNLKIDQGDHIKFFADPSEDIFEISFDLHSQNGDMRLFGETFEAKNVTVSTTKNSSKVLIDAEFEKKTADGSLITLWVKSTESQYRGDNIGTDAYGTVKVWMTSDSKDDGTMLSILSKLHYGKDYNELDNEEKNALAQDEVINLASDKLSDMFISPVLSPFEGAVRKFLGLDFFRLKTGFMKNLIMKSRVIYDRENFFDEQNEDQSNPSDLEYWSSDVILDDLSFDMGKYITRDWYVDYQATIQKGLNFSDEVGYGLQHQLTLRYDLPWNLRFMYMFRYSPILNEDIQRITLEAYINF